MKKISLKGISEILSENEMKNVMGGQTAPAAKDYCEGKSSCPCPSNMVCVDYRENGGKCCI